MYMNVSKINTCTIIKNLKPCGNGTDLVYVYAQTDEKIA